MFSGYLAPEYAMRGHMTEKVDVFAFGVVILETLAGRPNYDDSLDEDKAYLLEWVSLVCRRVSSHYIVLSNIVRRIFSISYYDFCHYIF